MQRQNRSSYQPKYSTLDRNSNNVFSRAQRIGDNTPRTIGRLSADVFKFLPQPQTVHSTQRYSESFGDTVDSSRTGSGAAGSRPSHLRMMSSHGFPQTARFVEQSTEQFSSQMPKVEQNTQRHPYPGFSSSQSSWSDNFAQIKPQVKSIPLHNRTARPQQQSYSQRHLPDSKTFIPHSGHDGQNAKKSPEQIPLSTTPTDHQLRQQWSSGQSGTGVNRLNHHQSQETCQSDVSSESGFLRASRESLQLENDNIRMAQHTSTPRTSQSSWEDIGDNYFVPIRKSKSVSNIAFNDFQSRGKTMCRIESPTETFPNSNTFREDDNSRNQFQYVSAMSSNKRHSASNEEHFDYIASAMKWNERPRTSNRLLKTRRQQHLEIFKSRACRPMDLCHPNIHRANLNKVFEDREQMLRKLEVGLRSMEGNHEKVILLLGATGSGKMSLINAMFNHIVGITWSDEFKLKLIDEGIAGQVTNQAESQTTWITSYTIHHSKTFTIPYTVTIIDTPGFADTAGIIRDKKIIDQIGMFFELKAPYGIDKVDAVGFVANSTLPRLTPTQKYIIDSILSLFGKDIEENIFVLFTFSDGCRPEALSAINEARVPYQSYFLFNNGNFYDRNNPLGETYWKLGKKSCESFFMSTDAAESKSLSQTREVMKSRYDQEIALQHIQRNITLHSRTVKELKQEMSALTRHKKDIERNQPFTFEAIEQYVVMEKVRYGYVAINCRRCHVTCYENVPHGRRETELLNIFIGQSCSTCFNKCHEDDHTCENFCLAFKKRTVEKSSTDPNKKIQRGQRERDECAESIGDMSHGNQRRGRRSVQTH